MEDFLITLHDKKTGTKLIECKSKGLIIMVMPRRHRARHLTDNTITIFANFYDKSLPPDEMFDKAKHILFRVLNINGPRAHEWTRELFSEAIDYYCNQYLKITHDGLSIPWSLEWESYCADDEYDFDTEVDPVERTLIADAYKSRFLLEDGEGANYDAAS